MKHARTAGSPRPDSPVSDNPQNGRGVRFTTASGVLGPDQGGSHAEAVGDGSTVAEGPTVGEERGVGAPDGLERGGDGGGAGEQATTTAVRQTSRTKRIATGDAGGQPDVAQPRQRVGVGIRIRSPAWIVVGSLICGFMSRIRSYDTPK